MIAKYSIQETEKIYLSPYYIDCGDYTITEKSLEIAIKSLWKSIKIDYHEIKYSMKDKFIEPVTFVNCFSEKTETYYYALQRETFKNFVYTHRNINSISRRVAVNASILVYINDRNPLYEDAYSMRYWFLLIARYYAKRYENVIYSDLTVNELLDACCRVWKDIKDDGELLPMMLKQSIKNCRHKTFTLGNISAIEKNRLSHKKKFTEEDIDYILYCRNIEGMSERNIKKAFEEYREKSVSLGMIHKVLNNSKNDCSQPGPSAPVNVFENIEENHEKETLPQVSWDEFYAFGEQGPGCEQLQSEARAIQAVESTWEDEETFLDTMITSDLE